MLVWALPGSLATTTGISLLMSSPRGTEMFQFPRCPPPGLWIEPAVMTLARHRVAPFGIGWLIACLQLPIHVSPFSASFVGHEPLGIHRTLYKAWQLLMFLTSEAPHLFRRSLSSLRPYRSHHGPRQL